MIEILNVILKIVWIGVGITVMASSIWGIMVYKKYIKNTLKVLGLEEAE